MQRPGFLFGLVLLTAIVGASARLARAADNYQVDPVHSSVIFKIKHMDTGWFYGRFNKISGTISSDSADASKMTFNIQIPVDSLDTNNPKRDSDVKGPDYFSAKEFPTISFKSTSVKSAGDNKFEVTGDLTMHGVTKPITITVEKTGAGNMRGMQKVGYATSFTVKRSDFGMKATPGMLGDEVELMVGIEAAKT